MPTPDSLGPSSLTCGTFHTVDGVRPESDHPLSLQGRSQCQRHSYTTFGTVRRCCISFTNCPPLMPVHSGGARTVIRRTSVRRITNRSSGHQNHVPTGKDPFHSAYSLVELLSVSHTTILNHLRDSLGMQLLHLRWIPHGLSEQLRAVRIQKC
jgi:hypothetical protein